MNCTLLFNQLTVDIINKGKRSMDYLSLEEVKVRIDKNYTCIRELESFIDLQNTEEEKLQLLSLIGVMYSEYVTGLYASDTLEKKILEVSGNIHFLRTKPVQQGKILIVMTKAAYIGGHTLLVHNWVQRDKKNQYSIVFTDMDVLDVPVFIKSIIKKSGGYIFSLTGNDMEKAERLLQVSESFERILLFSHMQDIIPVLAYGNKEWKTPIYFYNHADFRFSFGFSVSDVVLNLCEFDVNKTIRYRGIQKEKSLCMQFPIKRRVSNRVEVLNKQELRNRINEKYGIDNEKLVVSMGAEFKFEDIIDYQFDLFATELVKRRKGKINFLIVGIHRDNAKWQEIEKKTNRRVRVLGELSRSEAKKLIDVADLYITSFPMLAAGSDMADSAGVPWLCLDIIERIAVKDDIRCASTVEELITRSLDVLNGNQQLYLGKTNSDTWSEEKWLQEWQCVMERINAHEGMSFYPNRYIEKQEYVNCQLMQRSASKALYAYIMSHQINPDIRRRLLLLDQKYEMGIFHYDTDELSEHYNSLIGIADKYLQLYKTSIKWLNLRQKNIQVNSYLRAKGYFKVAIYGMGYMGKCLSEELNNDPNIMQYGIDQNANKIYSIIKVYVPTDRLEPVDLMINTTTLSNATILKIVDMEGVKIMQINELLDSICNML